MGHGRMEEVMSGPLELARTIYELKVALRVIEPPIWRRVQVRSDIPLDDLHEHLQIAMGWTNSHLHCFKLGDARFGIPNPEFPELAFRDERRVRLPNLLEAPGDELVYEYDFGDSWAHDIVLERALEPEPDTEYPRIVAGARACPPEDCGGVGGYEEFLCVIADPSHPEHGEMLAWAGGAFDPEAFDIEERNRLLRTP